MKSHIIQISLIALLVVSCLSDSDKNVETWKKEIVDTEIAFAKMADEEGIPKAFVTFSAEDVAVLRGKVLIKGREALKESYEKRVSSDKVSLTWSPDFVDVSVSGDLGYTYGKYKFTSTDSLGTTRTDEGIFHTVWKRQKDGSWKFVWD